MIYTKPEITISIFDIENIVTTSNIPANVDAVVGQSFTTTEKIQHTVTMNKQAVDLIIGYQY